MARLLGYARVSNKGQDADRRFLDLLAASVRRDDLYIDHGVSGPRASCPAFNWALDALHEGDSLVITVLNRLGRSTASMLGPSGELGTRGVDLRVLDLSGET